jgi:uncharacterized protein YegL
MGYLDEVKYAQNPEPRCACVLLLDTSYSMDGRPIQELNRGLQTFQEAIQKDDLARKRVEIAIVTFGNGGVQQKQDFVTAEAFEAPNPPLTAGGTTPMGEAIELGLDMIRSIKTTFRNNGIAFYRPWMFMITDGEPDSGWQSAAQRLHQEAANKGIVFFAVGVENANMQILSQITPTIPPAKLNGLNFKDMFLWLSNSMGRTSSTKVGENVALPPTDSWTTVIG